MAHFYFIGWLKTLRAATPSLSERAGVACTHGKLRVESNTKTIFSDMDMLHRGEYRQAR
jgi:hypothetical protein